MKREVNLTGKSAHKRPKYDQQRKDKPSKPPYQMNKFYEIRYLDEVVDFFHKIREEKKKERDKFLNHNRFYIHLWANGFFEIVSRDMLRNPLYVVSLDDSQFVIDKLKKLDLSFKE